MIACAAGGLLLGAQQPGDVVAAHRRMVEPGANGAHRVQEQAPAAGLRGFGVVGVGRQGVGEPAGDIGRQLHHDLLVARRGVVGRS